MPDNARWRDAAILQVHTVENGFVVHDRSRDWEESTRWVFSTGADLGEWMTQWAEHRHPQPQSAESEVQCANDCCGEKAAFELVVEGGNVGCSFSSSTPSDEVVDSLRSLKSISGNFVHFRLLDVAKGERQAIYFTQFSGLLTYLLAEYPGLMSGVQATSLMPL